MNECSVWPRCETLPMRWLAVDGAAMNVDHEPKDAFERAAVKELKSGKKATEKKLLPSDRSAES